MFCEHGGSNLGKAKFLDSSLKYTSTAYIGIGERGDHALRFCAGATVLFLTTRLGHFGAGALLSEEKRVSAPLCLGS